MSYIDKIKKQSTTYDINDARITITAEDEGKYLKVHNGALEWAEVSGGGSTGALIYDLSATAPEEKQKTDGPGSDTITYWEYANLPAADVAKLCDGTYRGIKIQVYDCILCVCSSYQPVEQESDLEIRFQDAAFGLEAEIFKDGDLGVYVCQIFINS